MGVPEGLRRFAGGRDNVAGVLQRCGSGTWDLLLIDAGGDWVRFVFSSESGAEVACDAAAIPLHRGWEDPSMGRRMNARDHWSGPGGHPRSL